MDVMYTCHGYGFAWDANKAQRNIGRHGIRFEEACEVFFDPFYLWEDASQHGEKRWGVVGYSESDRLLYVVATEHDDEAWRIISARKATNKERVRYEKNHAFI